MNAFLGMFLDEANDTLELWRELVAQLQAAGTCDFGALFRCAHNLKGSSASVGLTHYSAFLHEVEHLITLMRDGKVEVSDLTINILDATRIALDAWGMQLRLNPNAQVNVGEIVSRIDSIFLTLKKLDSPPPSLGVSTEIEGFHLFVDDPSPPETPPAEKTGGALAVPEATPLAPSHPGVPAAAAPPPPAPGGAKSSSSSSTQETIRVPRERLDALGRCVSEISLRIDAICLAQGATQDLLDLRKDVHEAQALSLGLVVASVSPLFDWLVGVAQDVAKKTNKMIQILVEGGETEIDKTILERMKDPLMHIIRNAVDHGLETTAQRKENGKGEVGQITLKAQKWATSVDIVVSDDGKGMVASALKRKAIEKGLIDPNSVLSESDCFELIFLPGFSTAAQVSDISGRGVGMDVVRQAVNAISGEISIESTPGKGSTFRMSFPSEVSIVDTMIVYSGQTYFGIPAEQVEEVHLSTDTPLQGRHTGERIFQRDGVCIPVFSLKEELAVSKTEQAVTSNPLAQTLLLTRIHGSLVGLEVEKVVTKRTLVVRRATAKYQKQPGVQALTIFDDGKPGLILDIKGLVGKKVQQRNTWQHGGAPL